MRGASLDGVTSPGATAGMPGGRRPSCLQQRLPRYYRLRSLNSTRRPHAWRRWPHFQSGIIPMTTTRLAIGIAATFLAAGCATRETAPYAQGKDCFYPACSIAVDVVDDGKGGKKLQVEADGNVRMGTRHRLVAIVWKLRTPGYEFRDSSVRPHAGRAGASPASLAGAFAARRCPSGLRTASWASSRCPCLTTRPRARLRCCWFAGCPEPGP